MNHFKCIATFLVLFLTGSFALAQIDPGGIGVVITNEAVINSKKLEFSPAFYEDGIVFISTNVPTDKFRVLDKRISKNVMSIYWAQRDSLGALMAPIPFASELLTKVHEGPVTFDRTGEQIFFTRNNNQKGKRKISSEGIAKLKIYSAIKFRDKWTSIEDLPFNNDQSNNAHPAISVEGDKMYFASDREGGQGGMDLYVVKRKGDSWGDPVNLGPNINTPGNEVFPFIHADGTLYFASDGHAGLGGFDLFYALDEATDQFGKPVNLKAPFNSELDDFGLIVDRDKRNGYFSSDRKGGLGEDDIYNFYITGNTSLVGGGEKEMRQTNLWLNVKEKFTGTPIDDARVSALNLDGLIPNQVITENSGRISNWMTPEEKENQLILQLAMDTTDLYGQTDMDGRLAMMLKGEQNVVTITKKGYQNLQVMLSDYTEGEEIYVEMEKATDCIPFTGEVLSVLGTPMTGAVVVIKEEDGNEEQRITIDQRGKFEYCLDRNKLYTVSILQDGKEIGSRVIGSIDSDANNGMPMFMVFNLADDPQYGLRKGLTVELPNIYYNFNDASIRPDARKDLDIVVNLLNKYPSLEIELSSHTDSRGGTRYNKKLSQKRAESAVAYLLNKGISESRVTAMGYGETSIRNRCTDGISCRESEHQYNRRTEIKVTKFDRPAAEVVFVQQPQTEALVAKSVASSSVSIDRPNAVGGQRVTGGTQYFRVIAGAFEVEENAQDRLSQVKNYGYDSAEIIQLGSEFKAVSVASFSTDQEAREFVKQLRDQHQLRSYIKRMNR